MIKPLTKTEQELHHPAGRDLPTIKTADGLLDPTVELTLTQARELTGACRTTLQRRRRDGLFPNARRRPGDRHRQWVLPIADLVTAGLLDGRKVADPAKLAQQADAENAREQIAQLRAQVSGLRETLAARADELAAHRDEIVFLRESFRQGRAA